MLIRLLHLASPTLPVGAYSYSPGLEWAVESGAIRNETAAGKWIGDALCWSMARWEAPLVGRLVDLWGSLERGAGQGGARTKRGGALCGPRVGN